MTLHARLLACLVALSLILGIGAGGAYASGAMNDPVAMSAMDDGAGRECGDCGAEKATPCAAGMQCALPMAIMPVPPAVTAAKPATAYRIADAVLAGRIGAPEPYPPKA